MSEEVIEFEIDFTPALRKHVQVVTWRYRFLGYLAVFSVMVLPVMIGTIRPWKDAEAAVEFAMAFGIYALIVLVAVLQLPISLYRTRHQVGVARYTLSSRGLAIDAPWETCTYRWENLRNRSNQGNIVFMRSLNGHIALPKEQLPGRAAYLLKEYVSTPDYSDAPHDHD